MSSSNAEIALAWQLTAAKVPDPVQEVRFDPTRRWRFDFAWPGHKVAVEVEGGGWVHGRHNRGDGFEQDCEKYNAAALLGWIVLRVTPRHVDDGRALRWIEEALRLQET